MKYSAQSQIPHPPVSLLLLALLVLGLPTAPALLGQETPGAGNLEGAWVGELALPGGQTLPLVFHLTEEADGSLGATMDSPLQGARGIPVDEVGYVDGVLTLSLSSLQARFQGEVTGDAIVGQWLQGGMEVPLRLEPAQEGVAAARPQDPEPPLPYQSEDVRYANPEAGIELAGTLTLPEGEGPFPAVALITGSGAQDRDQALMGHRPFLVLSDHLTRAGIAVLRSDDRGVGESGGDFDTATSWDFAGDAHAAVTYLRSRPEVDPEAVGLVGHSEGGLIAPMVAVEWGGVDFLVLLAGPALPGTEILRMQAEAIARAMGADDADVAQAREIQEELFRIILDEGDPEARVAQVRNHLTDVLAGADPDEMAAQGIPPGEEDAWVEGQLRMVQGEWFRTFLAHDPRTHLRQVTVPVLGLFGELDLQVPWEANREAMAQALSDGGNADVTLTVLPSLNHLFQTAETGAPTEYGQIQETFAPVALEAVSDWILSRTRK